MSIIKDAKERIRRKLAMLRKTQEVNEIIGIGERNEQALLNSAEDIKPSDESHALDLLESSEGSPKAKKSSAKKALGSRKTSAKKTTTRKPSMPRKSKEKKSAKSKRKRR